MLLLCIFYEILMSEIEVTYFLTYCTFTQINPFQPNIPFHIETSHSFCRAKQMTGF